MKSGRIGIFAAIIVFAIIFSAIAIYANNEEDKCGEAAYWSVDTESGVLTISGTGAISSSEPMPWYLSSLYIKKIVIGEGITEIPKKAFEDCNLVTEVSLPSSLTSVGADAFKNSNIAKVSCPCNCYAATYASDNSYKTELNHNYGEWETISVQGVGVEGLERRICSRCQKNDEKKYPALVNPFKDVPTSCWYTKDVIYCNDNGYMNGTTETEFSPNRPLTREQFVMILCKLSGADLSKITYRAIFTDVTDGKWYTKAVTWAYDYGITNGVGSGKFGIGNRVTRQELAVFLHTFAANFGKNPTGAYNITGYKDYQSVASWARESLSWALANKLMKGTTSTTLSPTITATRAQVAVTVKAYCENILKK